MAAIVFSGLASPGELRTVENIELRWITFAHSTMD